jgi:hypothetical protein
MKSPVSTTTSGRRADNAMTAQRKATAGCREGPLGALATPTVWGEGPDKAEATQHLPAP